jgi:gliding motility-associated-like protein
MKRYYILFILLLFASEMIATHNRAGEITFEHVEGYTYLVTITTYTYSPSPADRDFLEVTWGDGGISNAQRIEKILLPDYYQKNTYVATHTFPGPADYEIVVEDPNRNFGVVNIPNSVNVVFAIKTVFQIVDQSGNTSPVMLNPPIDKAALHRVFEHNPVAVDSVDGDSLSYKLATCLTDGGEEIIDYSYPSYTNAFYVNELSGDLVWDAPDAVGIYNVAMLIEEWRGSLKLSEIIRDMQIEVVETDNEPPVINALDPICIQAGDSIKITIGVSDPNGDKVTMTAFGIPFLVPESPAILSLPNQPSPAGIDNYLFQWNTKCSHVRKQPYQVTFKAIDEGTLANLVDLENLQITIVGPAPENPTLIPSNKAITLKWDATACSNASGYQIFRREGSYGFVPNECETGVPTYTGYELIGTTDAWEDTSFVDDNDGMGLRQGIEYCYMIVAYFDDASESYASVEVCGFLKNGIPMITNVDVEATSSDAGIINLLWAEPKELDTLGLSGPFHYLIYRSEGIWGENLQLIDSTMNKNDTIYQDQGLNTLEKAYSYRVELYHANPANRFLIGAPQIASSHYLEIRESDNELELFIQRNVPWIDSVFNIYRWNESLNQYDSIGYSGTNEFVDTDLNNGSEYCYRIKAYGYYNTNRVVYPLINHSQRNCGTPLDTVPPCQPDLLVGSICENFSNQLAWTNPNTYCANDVIGYKVYYTGTYDGEWELIASIDSADITTFSHDLFDLKTMAACYAVIAIDSFQNESEIVFRECVDVCYEYELPNVFTPNNDGKNDFFKPKYVDPDFAPYYLIEKIDLKIFNRWGNLVFQTEDPQINWDGTYLETGEKLSDGVYYYTCDVYTKRLSGHEHSTLVGFVHLFKDIKDAPGLE